MQFGKSIISWHTCCRVLIPSRDTHFTTMILNGIPAIYHIRSSASTLIQLFRTRWDNNRKLIIISPSRQWAALPSSLPLPVFLSRQVCKIKQQKQTINNVKHQVKRRNISSNNSIKAANTDMYFSRIGLWLILGSKSR